MSEQVPSKEKLWRVSPGDARYVFAPDLAAPINMQSKFRAAWLVEAANAHIERQTAARRDGAAHEPATAPVERYEEGLAILYGVNYQSVARVCDEVIDKSGALLGRVRTLARSAPTKGDES